MPVAAAILFAAMSTPSWADHGTDREGGIVTVTGTKPSSLPAYIPTSLESLTAEQIAQQINATDGEDVLKYFPSLLVRKRYIGDYNHAILSSRASGTGNSARSAVYMDGILLSNYLGNGVGGLSFPPRWGLVIPEEIERVDVLYGPFSAAYSGNSVGAVVDYVTRMPKAFEAHARVSYSHQPFDLYNTHQTYGAKQAGVSLGDRSGAFSWWLTLQHTDSTGQPLTFATRLASSGTTSTAGTPVMGAVAGANNAGAPWWIIGTGTQYATVQDHARIKLAYEISPVLRATWTLGSWRNESQGRAQSYLSNAAAAPVSSGVINIDGRSYAALTGADFALTNESLQHRIQAFSLKRSARDTFDWELAASRYDYQKDDKRQNGASNTLPNAASGGVGTLADGSGTGWTTLAARGIWRPEGPSGAHQVDVGLQQDRYELRYATFNIAGNWLSDAPGALASFVGGRTSLSSAYMQDVWAWAPQFKSVVGLRLERWEARDGVTNFSATSSLQHAARSESYLSPKAALSYAPSGTLVFKGSVGRAVRMPTVAELYGATSTTNSQYINDPLLKPEKSWTGELSAEADMAGGLARLTFFGETTRDALYSQSIVDPAAANRTISRVQNVGLIETRGLEWAISGRDVGIRGLDGQASLTYADSVIKENAGFVAVAGDTLGKRQPNIPKWRASAVATWRWATDWAGTLGIRYSGPQFRTLNNSDVNGATYMGVSSFVIADMRVRHQINRQWSAAAGIDNLNNRTYWNFHPYPQRSYTAELKVDL